MQSLDLTMVLHTLFQLLIAIVLAIPTAWNREKHTRSIGLRTFPLVSLGACAYVLIAQSFIGQDDSGSMARILQGLMSGIGFIGGGAILKNDDYVKGTASAASIWITGALGAAIGFKLWSLAVLLSILNFAIIFLLSSVKKQVATEEESL